MFFYFIIILYLYLFIKFLFYKKKNIKGKNILLLTAHPDDEIMFFFPTIKNLKYNNNLHLLCLSNGNYENMGKIREKEIKKVCELLNFKDIYIDKYEDNINIFWNTTKIKKKVEKYITKNNIHILITFDDRGVSYHPNHISCNIGTQNIKGIEIFNLETVCFYRKFISYFDIFNINNNDTVFLNINILEVIYYMLIHWSQMKWYRFLFLFFSRYSYINNLKSRIEK